MKGLLAALRALATVAGVWLFIQVLPRLLPEDPARIAAGEWATEAEVAAFRRLLGLDQPLLQALARSASDLLHGRMGTSLRFNRPVADILLGGLPVSLRLAFLALAASMLLAWAMALPRGRRIRALQAAAIASPVYVLGPLLLWAVAQHVPGLPVAGVQGWASWVLPAFTLAVPLAGHQARVLATQLEEVRESPGLRWWRASGVPGVLRWRAWLLPAVSGPWLTVLGLQLGGLLGGAVLVETIFALPGLGQILVGALASRDLPLVQGAVLWGAAAYVATQASVEGLQALLDPRAR